MNNMCSAVTAICAMIAVVFAFWSIRITIGDRRADRQGRRPYFTISAPGIKELSESPPYRIQITFANEGFNPATGFEGEILFLDASLKEEPELVVELSIANDIPRNSSSQWFRDEFLPGSNMPKKYIVIRIDYFDPLLKEEFRQSFFMKWRGVKNRILKPDFTHITKSEKAKVEEYLKAKSLL